MSPQQQQAQDLIIFLRMPKQVEALGEDTVETLVWFLLSHIGSATQMEADQALEREIDIVKDFISHYGGFKCKQV